MISLTLTLFVEYAYKDYFELSQLVYNRNFEFAGNLILMKRTILELLIQLDSGF